MISTKPILIATVLALALPMGSHATQSGPRWGGPTPTLTPLSPTGTPSPDPSDEQPGVRRLKVNQKVLFHECEANSNNCLCPRGAIARVFWESSSYDDPAKRKLMCIPGECPAGKILRKRIDAKTGVVSFPCVAPRS
jgi:hypothetical protein